MSENAATAGPMMTDAQAERAATVLLVVAAAGAAAFALRTPALRRQAWRALKAGLTTGIPGWISREVQQAWSESRPRDV